MAVEPIECRACAVEQESANGCRIVNRIVLSYAHCYKLVSGK